MSEATALLKTTVDINEITRIFRRLSVCRLFKSAVRVNAQTSSCVEL